MWEQQDAPTTGAGRVQLPADPFQLGSARARFSCLLASRNRRARASFSRSHTHTQNQKLAGPCSFAGAV
jgi:hypothetical protein